MQALQTRAVVPPSPPPPPAPSPPPHPPMVACSNTCDGVRNETSNALVNNSVCDDGGDGAQYSVCAWGTDCIDCGWRTGAAAAAVAAAAAAVLRRCHAGGRRESRALRPYAGGFTQACAGRSVQQRRGQLPAPALAAVAHAVIAAAVGAPAQRGQEQEQEQPSPFSTLDPNHCGRARPLLNPRDGSPPTPTASASTCSTAAAACGGLAKTTTRRPPRSASGPAAATSPPPPPPPPSPSRPSPPPPRPPPPPPSPSPPPPGIQYDEALINNIEVNEGLLGTLEDGGPPINDGTSADIDVTILDGNNVGNDNFAAPTLDGGGGFDTPVVNQPAMETNPAIGNPVIGNFNFRKSRQLL